MKICVISFSGRENGNCAGIMDLLCRELEQENQVEAFDFSSFSITPCGGCGYRCFEKADSCPYIGDPVYRIYDGITSGDLAYFIVPNYCDYPCSAYFAFNERSQCFFQGKPELLDKYLAVPKKFIVISNTGRENFTAAFRYQVNEDREPEILFLSAKRFGRVSIRGDLTGSKEAREAVKKFLKGDKLWNAV